ncbi:MAG: winged helix-turn-helix transcriptional regulator [Bacteroidota bacterium]
MNTPVPGTPVRGSQTGKPIMALFDLLGRSWAMGIVWNLSKGPHNFRQLQEKCEAVSPTTLNTRLKELKEARIIDHIPEGYYLTKAGHELFDLLVPLGTWSKRWAKKFDE